MAQLISTIKNHHLDQMAGGYIAKLYHEEDKLQVELKIVGVELEFKLSTVKYVIKNKFSERGLDIFTIAPFLQQSSQLIE